MEENEKKGLTLNQETVDVLVANIIPTTKYFESRFDHMQYQIDEIKKGQERLREEMNERFETIDRRFETMQADIDKRFERIDERFETMQADIDKRFEQIDKRFEQVDKKFEIMNASIQKLTLRVEELAKTQETTLRDYIIERDRYYDSKFNQLRMFNIATISLVAGVILKMMGIIHFG